MSDVIEEYAHDCRIVRETENSYEEYHYEGPLGRVQSFESLSKARLYADVHTVIVASERRRPASGASLHQFHGPVRTLLWRTSPRNRRCPWNGWFATSTFLKGSPQVHRVAVGSRCEKEGSRRCVGSRK